MFKIGPRVVLKIGPIFFIASVFFSVLGFLFFNTNSVNSCQNSVFAKLSGCQNTVFKRKLQFCFCLFMLQKDKPKKEETQNGKGQKHYINSDFKVLITKMRKMEKLMFLQKLPDTICVRKGEQPAFSCILSVLAKKCSGPKQPKPGKPIKKWFQHKLPKTKNDTFFVKKVFFGMVEKVGLLIVFLESCVLLKTLFVVFSANTAIAEKRCMLEKQKFMKNSGLFLNMARCFC